VSDPTGFGKVEGRLGRENHLISLYHRDQPDARPFRSAVGRTGAVHFIPPLSMKPLRTLRLAALGLSPLLMIPAAGAAVINVTPASTICRSSGCFTPSVAAT
jgi:hypothetical protein